MENRHIKSFLCNNCTDYSNIIICKTKYQNAGYMCSYCWKNFNKRLKQLYK